MWRKTYHNYKSDAPKGDPSPQETATNLDNLMNGAWFYGEGAPLTFARDI